MVTKKSPTSAKTKKTTQKDADIIKPVESTKKSPKKPAVDDTSAQQQPTEKLTIPRIILKIIGYSALVVITFFVSQFVFVIAAGIILGGERLQDLVSHSPTFGAASTAIIFALTLFFTIWLPSQILKIKTTLKEIGLIGLPTWTDILIAPVGYIVSALLGALLISIASQNSGFNAEQSQDLLIQTESLSRQSDYLITFITLVVLTPIVEEVLFRGYLYGKLRRYVNMWVASIIVGVVFGALHGQWNVGIVVFAMSFINCLIREKITGTIWGGILVHMLRNGIAFYLIYVNPNLGLSAGGN